MRGAISSGALQDCRLYGSWIYVSEHDKRMGIFTESPH